MHLRSCGLAAGATELERARAEARAAIAALSAVLAMTAGAVPVSRLAAVACRAHGSLANLCTIANAEALSSARLRRDPKSTA